MPGERTQITTLSLSHIQSTTEQQHKKNKGSAGEGWVPWAALSWDELDPQHFPIPNPFLKGFLHLSMNNTKGKTCQGNVSVAGVQDFEQDSDLLFILIPFILIVLQAEHPWVNLGSGPSSQVLSLRNSSRDLSGRKKTRFTQIFIAICTSFCLRFKFIPVRCQWQSYFCFSELWASSPREFLGFYTSTPSSRFPGTEHPQTKQMNKQQLGSYSQTATEVMFNVFPKVRGSNISLEGFVWGSNFLQNNTGFCLGVFLQEAHCKHSNTNPISICRDAIKKKPKPFYFTEEAKCTI